MTVGLRGGLALSPGCSQGGRLSSSSHDGHLARHIAAPSLVSTLAGIQGGFKSSAPSRCVTQTCRVTPSDAPCVVWSAAGLDPAPHLQSGTGGAVATRPRGDQEPEGQAGGALAARGKCYQRRRPGVVASARVARGRLGSPSVAPRPQGAGCSLGSRRTTGEAPAPGSPALPRGCLDARLRPQLCSLDHRSGSHPDACTLGLQGPPLQSQETPQGWERGRGQRELTPAPSKPYPHTSRTEAGPRPPREPSRPDTRGCSQGRAPGGQGAGVCAHHCSAVSSGLLVLGSDGDHRGGELCRSTQGWRGAGPERAARTGRVKPGPRAGPGRSRPPREAPAPATASHSRGTSGAPPLAVGASLHRCDQGRAACPSITSAPMRMRDQGRAGTRRRRRTRGQLVRRLPGPALGLAASTRRVRVLVRRAAGMRVLRMFSKRVWDAGEHPAGAPTSHTCAQCAGCCRAPSSTTERENRRDARCCGAPRPVVPETAVPAASGTPRQTFGPRPLRPWWLRPCRGLPGAAPGARDAAVG